MISPRLLSAIGLACMAVPAHAEEDAVVLYRDICIASNGDLLKGEQLAIANGFSIDPGDAGRRTYTRGGSGSSMPVATFKPAGSETNRSVSNICQVFGSTDRLSEFDAYAQSRGMREIPEEEILGDFSGQNYALAFVSNECAASKCFFVVALGDPPVDGKFSGVFRFGMYSPHAMLEEE